MTDRDEQMLTIGDVAGFLQVAVKTVRRLVDNGEFPKPVRVGIGERWSMGDFRKWQWEQRMKADHGSAGLDNGGQAKTSEKQT